MATEAETQEPISEGLQYIARTPSHGAVAETENSSISHESAKDGALHTVAVGTLDSFWGEILVEAPTDIQSSIKETVAQHVKIVIEALDNGGDLTSSGNNIEAKDGKALAAKELTERHTYDVNVMDIGKEKAIDESTRQNRLQHKDQDKNKVDAQAKKFGMLEASEAQDEDKEDEAEGVTDFEKLERVNKDKHIKIGAETGIFIDESTDDIDSAGIVLPSDSTSGTEPSAKESTKDTHEIMIKDLEPSEGEPKGDELESPIDGVPEKPVPEKLGRDEDKHVKIEAESGICSDDITNDIDSIPAAEPSEKGNTQGSLQETGKKGTDLANDGPEHGKLESSLDKVPEKPEEEKLERAVEDKNVKIESETRITDDDGTNDVDRISVAEPSHQENRKEPLEIMTKEDLESAEDVPKRSELQSPLDEVPEEPEASMLPHNGPKFCCLDAKHDKETPGEEEVVMHVEESSPKGGERDESIEMASGLLPEYQNVLTESRTETVTANKTNEKHTNDKVGGLPVAQEITLETIEGGEMHETATGDERINAYDDNTEQIAREIEPEDKISETVFEDQRYKEATDDETINFILDDGVTLEKELDTLLTSKVSIEENIEDPKNAEETNDGVSVNENEDQAGTDIEKLERVNEDNNFKIEAEAGIFNDESTNNIDSQSGAEPSEKENIKEPLEIIIKNLEPAEGNKIESPLDVVREKPEAEKLERVNEDNHDKIEAEAGIFNDESTNNIDSLSGTEPSEKENTKEPLEIMIKNLESAEANKPESPFDVVREDPEAEKLEKVNEDNRDKIDAESGIFNNERTNYIDSISMEEPSEKGNTQELEETAIEKLEPAKDEPEHGKLERSLNAVPEEPKEEKFERVNEDKKIKIEAETGICDEERTTHVDNISVTESSDKENIQEPFEITDKGAPEPAEDVQEHGKLESHIISVPEEPKVSMVPQDGPKSCGLNRKHEKETTSKEELLMNTEESSSEDETKYRPIGGVAFKLLPEHQIMKIGDQGEENEAANEDSESSNENDVVKETIEEEGDKQEDTTNSSCEEPNQNHINMNTRSDEFRNDIETANKENESSNEHGVVEGTANEGGEVHEDATNFISKELGQSIGKDINVITKEIEPDSERASQPMSQDRCHDAIVESEATGAENDTLREANSMDKSIDGVSTSHDLEKHNIEAATDPEETKQRISTATDENEVCDRNKAANIELIVKKDVHEKMDERRSMESKATAGLRFHEEKKVTEELNSNNELEHEKKSYDAVEENAVDNTLKSILEKHIEKPKQVVSEKNTQYVEKKDPLQNHEECFSKKGEMGLILDQAVAGMETEDLISKSDGAIEEYTHDVVIEEPKEIFNSGCEEKTQETITANNSIEIDGQGRELSQKLELVLNSVPDDKKQEIIREKESYQIENSTDDCILKNVISEQIEPNDGKENVKEETNPKKDFADSPNSQVSAKETVHGEVGQKNEDGSSNASEEQIHQATDTKDNIEVGVSEEEKETQQFKIIPEALAEDICQKETGESDDIEIDDSIDDEDPPKMIPGVADLNEDVETAKENDEANVNTEKWDFSNGHASVVSTQSDQRGEYLDASKTEHEEQIYQAIKDKGNIENDIHKEKANSEQLEITTESVPQDHNQSDGREPKSVDNSVHNDNLDKTIPEIVGYNDDPGTEKLKGEDVLEKDIGYVFDTHELPAKASYDGVGRKHEDAEQLIYTEDNKEDVIQEEKENLDINLELEPEDQSQKATSETESTKLEKAVNLDKDAKSLDVREENVSDVTSQSNIEESVAGNNYELESDDKLESINMFDIGEEKIPRKEENEDSIMEKTLSTVNINYVDVINENQIEGRDGATITANSENIGCDLCEEKQKFAEEIPEVANRNQNSERCNGDDNTNNGTTVEEVKIPEPVQKFQPSLEIEAVEAHVSDDASQVMKVDAYDCQDYEESGECKENAKGCHVIERSVSNENEEKILHDLSVTSTPSDEASYEDLQGDQGEHESEEAHRTRDGIPKQEVDSKHKIKESEGELKDKGTIIISDDNLPDIPASDEETGQVENAHEKGRHSSHEHTHESINLIEVENTLEKLGNSSYEKQIHESISLSEVENVHERTQESSYKEEIHENINQSEVVKYDTLIKENTTEHPEGDCDSMVKEDDHEELSGEGFCGKISEEGRTNDGGAFRSILLVQKVEGGELHKAYEFISEDKMDTFEPEQNKGNVAMNNEEVLNACLGVSSNTGFNKLADEVQHLSQETTKKEDETNGTDEKAKAAELVSEMDMETMGDNLNANEASLDKNMQDTSVAAPEEKIHSTPEYNRIEGRTISKGENKEEQEINTSLQIEEQECKPKEKENEKQTEQKSDEGGELHKGDEIITDEKMEMFEPKQNKGNVFLNKQEVFNACQGVSSNTGFNKLAAEIEHLSQETAKKEEETNGTDEKAKDAELECQMDTETMGDNLNAKEANEASLDKNMQDASIVVPMEKIYSAPEDERIEGRAISKSDNIEEQDINTSLQIEEQEGNPKEKEDGKQTEHKSDEGGELNKGDEIITDEKMETFEPEQNKGNVIPNKQEISNTCQGISSNIGFNKLAAEVEHSSQEKAKEKETCARDKKAKDAELVSEMDMETMDDNLNANEANEASLGKNMHDAPIIAPEQKIHSMPEYSSIEGTATSKSQNKEETDINTSLQIEEQEGKPKDKENEVQTEQTSGEDGELHKTDELNSEERMEMFDPEQDKGNVIPNKQQVFNACQGESSNTGFNELAAEVEHLSQEMAKKQEETNGIDEKAKDAELVSKTDMETVGDNLHANEANEVSFDKNMQDATVVAPEEKIHSMPEDNNKEGRALPKNEIKEEQDIHTNLQIEEQEGEPKEKDNEIETEQKSDESSNTSVTNEIGSFKEKVSTKNDSKKQKFEDGEPEKSPHVLLADLETATGTDDILENKIEKQSTQNYKEENFSKDRDMTLVGSVVECRTDNQSNQSVCNTEGGSLSVETLNLKGPVDDVAKVDEHNEGNHSKMVGDLSVTHEFLEENIDRKGEKLHLQKRSVKLETHEEAEQSDIIITQNEEIADKSETPKLQKDAKELTKLESSNTFLSSEEITNRTENIKMSIVSEKDVVEALYKQMQDEDNESKKNNESAIDTVPNVEVKEYNHQPSKQSIIKMDSSETLGTSSTMASLAEETEKEITEKFSKISDYWPIGYNEEASSVKTIDTERPVEMRSVVEQPNKVEKFTFTSADLTAASEIDVKGEHGNVVEASGEELKEASDLERKEVDQKIGSLSELTKDEENAQEQSAIQETQVNQLKVAMETKQLTDKASHEVERGNLQEANQQMDLAELPVSQFLMKYVLQGDTLNRTCDEEYEDVTDKQNDVHIPKKEEKFFLPSAVEAIKETSILEDKVHIRKLQDSYESVQAGKSYNVKENSEITIVKDDTSPQVTLDKSSSRLMVTEDRKDEVGEVDRLSSEVSAEVVIDDTTGLISTDQSIQATTVENEEHCRDPHLVQDEKIQVTVTKETISTKETLKDNETLDKDFDVLVFGKASEEVILQKEVGKEIKECLQDVGKIESSFAESDRQSTIDEDKYGDISEIKSEVKRVECGEEKQDVGHQMQILKNDSKEELKLYESQKDEQSDLAIQYNIHALNMAKKFLDDENSSVSLDKNQLIETTSAKVDENKTDEEKYEEKEEEEYKPENSGFDATTVRTRDAKLKPIHKSDQPSKSSEPSTIDDHQLRETLELQSEDKNIESTENKQDDQKQVEMKNGPNEEMKISESQKVQAVQQSNVANESTIQPVQMTEKFSAERSTVVSIGESQTVQIVDSKVDEDKIDDEKHEKEEEDEHNPKESGHNTTINVEGTDAELKPTPKKSHGILSGVGSKVKHSIAKVKKVITGKSSHSKALSAK